MTSIAAIREIRETIVNKIADEFEQSGIKYTCAAVVMDYAETRIIPHTEGLPGSVTVHNLMSFRKLKRNVSDEIHRRYLANKQAPAPNH